MEISLEVLVSAVVGRKKPCPKLHWLGQETESVFIVDEKQFGEVRLRSGSVKKVAPRLQGVLNKQSVAALATSANGVWLAGLHVSGELFIWNKDQDSLQTAAANAEVSQIVSEAQAHSVKLYLCVSGDGSRALLATHTGSVFLWERDKNWTGSVPSKNPSGAGRWTKIEPQESTAFPSVADKEAALHAVFVESEVLGDCCLCAFVFYFGARLVTTWLALRWYENDQKFSRSPPFDVRWAQQDCSPETFHPPCQPVKSRGALLAVFSGDGLVLAITINQKDPKATQVLFINTMNFVTVSGHLRGCSSKDQHIPSRFIRSYWVGDMSWTADSLFLACVLKRGSLLLMTRLGELLTLKTFGCSVEFGPAEFIPLHPLITYRPPFPTLEQHDPDNSLGSTASATDTMRQRYSVTCHPRLPYLIISDGYMVTVLRFAKNASSYSFLKSLLLDAAQRLEDVRQRLPLAKPKNKLNTLRSLSGLKANLLKDDGDASLETWTIPNFLQGEEESYRPGDQSAVQLDDNASDDEGFRKFSVPSDRSFGGADQGRLEFASMFDTMHASDRRMGKNDGFSDLHRIQKSLITAWMVGVKMRGLEEKDTLLRYTVGCLTHLLSALQSSTWSALKSQKSSRKMGKPNPCVVYLTVIQQCLTVLYWDVAPKQAVKHIIKLTSDTAKMILAHGREIYSKRLIGCFCLLKMVSRHLNIIYNLHCESVSVSADGRHGACLDHMKIPVFEALNTPEKDWSVGFDFKEPPQPVSLGAKTEKRLAALWRLLYNQTLWYRTQLTQRGATNPSKQVQSEMKITQSIMCHVQAELQSAGECLDPGLRLMPIEGEELFLLGSYQESVEFWKRALLETTVQGGKRASFLQTRYYLAVLYCHLYNYNLNDAQGVCDQLVRELLRRSSLLQDTEQDAPRSCEDDQWMLGDVHHEAALAVIQSMGRFMAAYFTNQPLYVFPPHNVSVLLPLHIVSDRIPRVVRLQHGLVAGAVRDQSLSSVWTVEYVLDLLLVSGLMAEAAWLANKLGDWKMSVSMGVAYNMYQESLCDEFKSKAPPLPPTLNPAHTFREKLQFFLGRPGSETSAKDPDRQKLFTDPIEEEDADILFSSVQEMLKAAVMANAEILTDTLLQLMVSAKTLIRKLSGLVPEQLYLPAPPLYCPQPASVSKEDSSDLPFEAEKSSREKLSGVLQRVLLLLRAARCSLPAAQWYIKQIKRARKIMHKIRAKGSLPALNVLPETLLNYANNATSCFKPQPSDVQQSDPVTSTVIGCFRELCALCWMLHVRERLSYCCRRYQKARDGSKLVKAVNEHDPCVTAHCFEVLDWACRMLPFSRITNCEELVQDLILSLVSELPTVKKVAEILVKAFPHPDVVRVPLREKYHSVQQRLRHSMVKGPQGEEMMSVIIHNVQRVRVKALRRVQRNIGPVESHLWESALGEASDEESYSYDRFSLGTTLSRSTLTDFGRSQTYSEADTLSEAQMTKDTSERTDGEFVQDLSEKNPTNEAIGQKSRVLTEPEHAWPKVGVWEFERDDEEYTNFLDLFLSYILEKDLLRYSEPGIPFLTTFAHHLREHELNSLVFDVHTTLKRKLGKSGIQSVFRAGSCYDVNSAPCNDSVGLEGTLHQNQGTADGTANAASTILSIGTTNAASTIMIEKAKAASYKSFLKVKSKIPARSGLFGLKARKTPVCDRDSVSSKDLPCDLSGFNRCGYRVNPTRNFQPSEELGLELQMKFGNEAKLVEWLVRWSDRRLFWSAGKAEPCLSQGAAIRVKTSSAAILTSIWLLEKPYMGCGYRDRPRYQIPSGDYIVAPASQPLPSQSVVQSEMPEMDAGHAESEEGLLTISEERSESHSWSEIPSRASPAMQVTQDGRPFVPNEESSADFHVAAGNDDDTPPQTEEKETCRLANVSSDDQDDDTDDAARSPNISVSIQSISQRMEKAPGELSVIAREQEQPASPGADEPERIGERSPTAQAQPHLLQPVLDTPDVMPDTETIINRQAAPPEHSSRPANTSEAVRQLFQDEMFRLLQLQQINFMSLMQVVGSSFAALPHLQHMLPQTSGANQMVNPAGLQAAFQSQTPENIQNDFATNPGTQTKDRPGKPQPATTIMAASGEPCATRDQSNKENMDLPNLNISLNHEKEKERTSEKPDRLAVGLPLMAPPPVLDKVPMLIPSAKVSADFNGLPLLKLHPQPSFKPLNVIPGSRNQEFAWSKGPTAPREAWAPADAGQIIHSSRKVTPKEPPNPDHSKGHLKPLGKTEENTRWADMLHRRPAEEHHSWSGVSMYSQNAFAERMFKGPQNVSPGPASTPAAGIPLLHLRTEHVILFPPIAAPDFRVPPVQPTTERDAVTMLPPTSLKLLQTSVPRQMQTLPSGPAPRLLPLQTLLEFHRDHTSRGTSEGSLPLLKANLQQFEEVVKRGDSLKREKRRSRQQKEDKREKKGSVTFRPEASIINPNNLDEVAHVQDLLQETSVCQERSEFVIPLGTFESLLSKDIPEDPVPSVAELHYMASTTKTAPEIKDAGTNTDSGPVQLSPLAVFPNECTKSYENKGTGCDDLPNAPSPASRPAPGLPPSPDAPRDIPLRLPPELLLNLRFQDEEERTSPPRPDLPQIHVGHRYISVIDIDAGDFPKGFPGPSAHVAPSEKEGDRWHPLDFEETEKSRDPTPEEPDRITASVSRAALDSHYHATEHVSEAQERQRLERTPSSADSVTYSMLAGKATGPPSDKPVARPRAAVIAGTDRALSRLQEMDAQLAALQNMADGMERDFANTELLVNTIENLSSAVDLHPKAVGSSYGVTDKAFAVNDVELEAASEGDEDPLSAAVTLSRARPAVVAFSPRDSGDARRPAAPAQQDNEDKSILDMSGLRDITDILKDLLEGGVSAAELGLTETQAGALSRAREKKAASHQVSKRSPEERSEIQKWMKRKQRERLAEHKRKLEQLREMEHNPYQPQPSANSLFSTKVIRQNQREKDEKDKSLLSEHHGNRVSDALNLMHEMLSEAKQIPVISPKTKPTASRKPASVALGTRASPKGSLAGKRRPVLKGGFSQSRTMSSPLRPSARGTTTFVRPKGSPDHKTKNRSAPSYPVRVKYDASLPGDPTSQITRRGMLAGRKRANVNYQNGTRSPARHSAPAHHGMRDTGSSFTRSVTQTGDNDRMERDVVSPWEVPDEINKILNSHRDSILSQGSLFNADDLSHNPKLDNSSESTSSLLSKLDWKAIEDMVASIE
ncbi:ciliogenesis and planar polarity effector 1 [Spea bombifrons]|uniref:ciliogenesis and planar polarity effector 1 n=1 Tax=Spea bombifrons TaxID=233779 RepID=UPI00234BE2F2|nr:ciliogenesis and planar polarity effector 1 [Spea bombifrons]